MPAMVPAGHGRYIGRLALGYKAYRCALESAICVTRVKGGFAWKRKGHGIIGEQRSGLSEMNVALPCVVPCLRFRRQSKVELAPTGTVSAEIRGRPGVGEAGRPLVLVC